MRGKDLPTEPPPLFIRFSLFELRCSTDPTDIPENCNKIRLFLHQIPPHAFIGTSFKINALLDGNSSFYDDNYLLKYISDQLLPNYCHSYSLQFNILSELCDVFQLISSMFQFNQFCNARDIRISFYAVWKPTKIPVKTIVNWLFDNTTTGKVCSEKYLSIYLHTVENVSELVDQIKTVVYYI